MTRRPFGPVGSALALALVVGLCAGPAPASAAPAVPSSAAPAAPTAADGVKTCARPALASSLRLGKPGKVDLEVGDAGRTRNQARLAHRVATRGRQLEKPARAQALAVAAALAGDLPKRPDAFYRDLAKVKGWQTLPPTIAVHRVLGTPDPFAYESWWDRSVRLLGKMMARRGKRIEVLVSPGGRTPTECYASATDRKSLPLPAGSGYRVRSARGAGGKNAGQAPKGNKNGKAKKAGARQKPGETGFEAACGTPVVAATPGTVEVVRHNPAAGPWTIKVHQADTGITARYTHVQNVTVENGATVLVGQQLAEVGDLGAVSSCTLGMSVTRKRNGRTQVLDPATWLVPKDVPAGPVTIPATTFRVGTYNVLGHRLTAPGGGRPGWASGTSRVARGMARVSAHGISILVLNELEYPQAAVVRNHGWTLHHATPNNRNGHGNGIAWRGGTWEQVSTDEFSAPIKRRRLYMPVVKLRHKETGALVTVIGIHNPPYSYQGRQRAVARAIEMDYIRNRRATEPDVPVIIAGDFNERDIAYRGMTGTGLLKSSAGGGRHPVDWIFGTTDLEFHGETVERFESARISDHPLVLASVVIPEHEREVDDEPGGDD